MRTILIALFTMSGFLAFANGDPVKTINVNTEKSQIQWKGKKITGSHEGTIKVKSGTLEFDSKDVLSGGTIVIDMTSMECTDMKGDGAKNLVGHLGSDDFFSIANHPEAMITLKKVDSKEDGKVMILGDITIKNITNEIKFEADLSKYGYATAKVDIDRTKFGIRYGSGSFFDNLGDKAIKDKFTLNISLMFEQL